MWKDENVHGQLACHRVDDHKNQRGHEAKSGHAVLVVLELAFYAARMTAWLLE